MDSYLELELKLISLITQLVSLYKPIPSNSDFVEAMIQLVDFISSMDLNSQPKPESELMSLIAQTISIFNSMDLYSLRKTKFQSLIARIVSIFNHLHQKPMRQGFEQHCKGQLQSLFYETLRLKPEPKLISVIHRIVSIVISMNSEWKKLISVSPQVSVFFKKGKFLVNGEVIRPKSDKWDCLPTNWEKYRLVGEDDTHFFCPGCNGQNHEEYNKAPVKIQHILHPKHSLQLVFCTNSYKDVRSCYCCGEVLQHIFYHCPACDFTMNFACFAKQHVSFTYHPKWHQHTLVLFPNRASLTCNLCALTHSRCPFYTCPPCDFVVHQSCFSLPSVIRISRHPHRITFTSSFDQGDRDCGVCRRKIDNDYGGYCCIKDGCSYAAHSICATQSNVWDGKELEGEPEETEEETEPFVEIGDGIIQHFSHQHHHLRLDENKSRDYDENMICQACITPIYFGNFYSCMTCAFILHEACAKLSRKIYHPIHPHMLTLVVKGYENVEDYDQEGSCSVCPWMCIAGFVYMCGKQECRFKLHVQCATISEPLLHGSHVHPLYLTSKPGEGRICSVCKPKYCSENQTFNCIKECDFALCFKCATLPQEVRYKHDKHMLTLSYGEETSSMTYWCEVCEGKINTKERFYMCNEYCCVTLHIKCFIGKDLYIKPNIMWFHQKRASVVMSNNQQMSRPICYFCKKRCPYNIVFKSPPGLIFCSTSCLSRIVNW